MTHSHDRTLLASLSFADPDKKDPRHTLATRYLTEKVTAERLLTRVLVPTGKAEVVEWNEHKSPPPGKEFRGTRTIENINCYGIASEVAITTGRNGFLVGFLDMVYNFSYSLTCKGEKFGWKNEYVDLVMNDVVTQYAFQLNNDLEKWNTEISSSKDGVISFYLNRRIHIPAEFCSRFGDQRSYDDSGVLCTLRLKHGKIVASVPLVLPNMVWSNYESSSKISGGGGDPAPTLVIEIKINKPDVGDLLRQMNLYKKHVDGRHVRWLVVSAAPFSKSERSFLRNEDIHFLQLGPDFDAFCAKAREPEAPDPDSIL